MAFPTNTPVWTVIFDDFIVHWTWEWGIHQMFCNKGEIEELGRARRSQKGTMRDQEEQGA